MASAVVSRALRYTFRHLPQIIHSYCRRSVYLHCRTLCHLSSLDGAYSVSKEKSIGDYFIDPEVQTILKKITGINYSKIFHPVEHPLVDPKYEFATDKRVEELKQEAVKIAQGKLQMPPVVEIFEEKPEVISYNPELQGCEELTWGCNLLFIDVSLNTYGRDRLMTVREPDGTLRRTCTEERTRLNQIYFPVDGRYIEQPELFESPHLNRLLDEQSYLYVLDRACVQFEPYDAEYHRVTHATYDHINEEKQFDLLRSTRHFGPMAFYFAWTRNIENLLSDMLQRELLGDAADLIRLQCILHHEKVPASKSDMDIVTDFISQNSSPHKANLELMFQTYKEVRSMKKEDEEPTASVSSV